MSVELPNDLPEAFRSLGPPEAEFAVRGSSVFWRVVGIPVAFLAGLALLLAVILVPPKVRIPSRVKVGLFGLVLMAGAVLLAFRTYRSRELRVLVYPEGMLYLRPDQARAVLWDEIDTVRHTKAEGHLMIFLSSSEAITVSGPRIGELHFDDCLPQIGELAGLIRRHTLGSLLSRAVAAYEAGEPVVFGEIQISREGITKGGRTLPWPDVKEIQFEEEKITVTRQGKWLTWLTASAGEVPNFHVLRGLLEYARKTEGEKRA